MQNNIEALRANVRQRLHSESVSLAVIVATALVLLALTATDSLPALHGDQRISGFLSGFVMGLFAVAAVITVRQLLNLRHALTSETELRRLYAQEHDELRAHLERETARTYVQLMPALASVAIFVGALVSFESMATAAATTVFLSLARLVVKLVYKRRLATPETE